MTAINETLIRDVVSEVLSRLQGNGTVPAARIGPTGSSGGVDGVFQNVNDAVAAAKAAFRAAGRRPRSRPGRKAIECIREICIEQAEELGRFELDETKIGRLDHKIEKLKRRRREHPGRRDAQHRSVQRRPRPDARSSTPPSA